MTLRGAWPRLELPLFIGFASSGCALAGLAAWIGYVRNAGAAIQAVHVRGPAEAHRPAVVAGWCSLAQMVLGFIAVGLSWYVRSRTNISGLVNWTSGVGFALGVGVLLLTLLLV